MWHAWHGFGGMFGWWGAALGFIGHLIFTMLIITAVVLLLKKFSYGQGTSREASPGALEIAKQRYAKGEISAAEYHQIKKEIE